MKDKNACSNPEVVSLAASLSKKWKAQFDGAR
jgi:hypothetical protein